MPSPAKKPRNEGSSNAAAAAGAGTAAAFAADAAEPLPFKQQLIDHLCTRLRDPRSPEAAAAPLRPSLQPLEQEMTSILQHAVVNGQNVSMLVIGEPGSGKTLVRLVLFLVLVLVLVLVLSCLSARVRRLPPLRCLLRSSTQRGNAEAHCTHARPRRGARRRRWRRRRMP